MPNETPIPLQTMLDTWSTITENLVRIIELLKAHIEDSTQGHHQLPEIKNHLAEITVSIHALKTQQDEIVKQIGQGENSLRAHIKETVTGFDTRFLAFLTVINAAVAGIIAIMLHFFTNNIHSVLQEILSKLPK